MPMTIADPGRVMAVLVPDHDGTGPDGVAVLAAGRPLAPGLQLNDLVVATEVRTGRAVLPCPSAPLLLGALRRAGLPARTGPVTAAAVRAALRPEPLVVTGPVPPVFGAEPCRALVCAVDLRSRPDLPWQAVPVMLNWRDALGARRVVLAGPWSLCSGVECAIEVAEHALQTRGSPIYVWKQIVHNEPLVRELERRGAVVVDELDQIPDQATPIFSAHGVVPAVRAEAARRGLEVIDATCPLVTKVQTAGMVAAGRRMFPAATGPGSDNICDATADRRHALPAVAAESDLVLVLGSATSSRSRRLVEHIERLGTPAHLVDDTSDIRLHWLVGATTIGVTAGASAPSTLMRGVVANLAGLGPVTVAAHRAATEAAPLGCPNNSAHHSDARRPNTFCQSTMLLRALTGATSTSHPATPQESEPIVMPAAVSSRPRLKVLVIGAGVVGLTTALCARRAGHDVVIAADRFAPDITSVVAGALWEWPPAVCGRHRDEESLERSKEWCMTSYRMFHRLATNVATGVHIRPATFYFRQTIEDNPIEYHKMWELQHHVRGFRRDPGLAHEHGVSPAAGARDAYTYLAPMIDTDTYLGWLLNQATDSGCQVVRARVDGDLATRERQILDHFDVDAIVNCSGLGSRQLTGESLYPLRGALIHAHNDGRTMPRITGAHCMAYDENLGGQNMVFIVPRGPDRLVLGGLVEADQWNTNLTLDSYPPLRTMLDRCQAFLPALRNATLVTDRTVRVGLRPASTHGVRLDHQPGTRILHNVGHGGSGVTFSWGCAREILSLLDQIPSRFTPSRVY